MEFEKSRIERLKQSLYSRDESRVPKEKRTPVHGQQSEVPENWGAPPSFALIDDDMTPKNNSFFNKFLLVSLVFFVISLGVAAFIFFGGMNMISSSNVDVKIVGSNIVSSGSELDLGLSIVNNNRTDLEGVTLYIDYPSGTKSIGTDSQPLAHDKIDLGTISKGGDKNYTLRALFLGEKDAVKTISFRVEYKIQGSNAVFSKDKTYDVSIGSSPLLLNVAYPAEINSGQPVTLSIDVTSNSSNVIQNTLVKVDYPYGFTYTDSNIKPLRDNSVWSIGDLKNGDKKTLTIKGTLVGQDMEDRSFRISSGIGADSSAKDFDTDLAVSQVTVGIRKSFFDLSIVPSSGVDGSVVNGGENAPLAIAWKNTLTDKIVNARVQATISGNAFDPASVFVGNGVLYQSSNGSISWDKNSISTLSEINPAESGTVSFSVGSFKNQSQIRTLSNPHIDVHVVMSGDKLGDTPSPVSSTEDITIKIKSVMSFAMKTLRYSGDFSNTGPIPPQADNESTYTIKWTLTNTTNDLKDAVVTAALPSNVTWKGEISPSDERIVYNPDTKQISWNVGNVSAGTGFDHSPREVSFKVGLTPNITQAGLSLGLISQATARATDVYTGATLTSIADSVNTHYADPGFKAGDDVVVK